MLNQEALIKKLNNTCKIFFTESSFNLRPIAANKFSISGDRMSKAINNHKNERKEVNVLKWFDEFWIYADIRFEDANTFISLTVFQGDEATNNKHQLFRAEWDDFNNREEIHSQPHWHITNNQVIEKTFEELSILEDSNTFVEILNEEKSKIIDINRMHFAMNGNWINNESEIHPLNSEKKIVAWFQGLLSHLRTELKYVK